MLVLKLCTFLYFYEERGQTGEMSSKKFIYENYSISRCYFSMTMKEKLSYSLLLWICQGNFQLFVQFLVSIEVFWLYFWKSLWLFTRPKIWKFTIHDFVKLVVAVIIGFGGLCPNSCHVTTLVYSLCFFKKWKAKASIRLS